VQASRRFARLLLPLLVAVVGGVRAGAEVPSSETIPSYSLGASLAPDLKQIDGSVEVTFTNHGSKPLHEAVFVLFPNRFSEPDSNVDDFTRAYVYPREEYEAASMEIPLITTDSVGCRDTVDDGRTGYLCKPKDTADLANKMRLMLSLSAQKRREMGRAGREKTDRYPSRGRR